MASSDLENNKIFAAILLAGIVAMLSGFIAKKVVKTDELEEDAYPIEVTDVAASGGAAAAPKGPDPIADLLATADIARGQKLSKSCAACHSFDNGGPSKIGPNLWNIVNKPKGGKAGFAYSSALKESGGNWTYDSLNAFLWKPKKYMPGTKMNYAGMRKAEDRAAMVKWLESLR